MAAEKAHIELVKRQVQADRAFYNDKKGISPKAKKPEET